MMYVCFHMLMYIYIAFNSLTCKFECIHVFVWVGIYWEVWSQCVTNKTAFCFPHTGKSCFPSQITALGIFHTFWTVWVIWYLSHFLPNHNVSSWAQISHAKEATCALEGCALCCPCIRTICFSLRTNKRTRKRAPDHRLGQGFLSPPALRTV